MTDRNRSGQKTKYLHEYRNMKRDVAQQERRKKIRGKLAPLQKALTDPKTFKQAKSLAADDKNCMLVAEINLDEISQEPYYMIREEIDEICAANEYDCNFIKTRSRSAKIYVVWNLLRELREADTVDNGCGMEYTG